MKLKRSNRLAKKLIAAFGALTVSSLSAPYQGTWKYSGVEYVDDIIKIEIITADDRKTEKFFKEFKEHLKSLLGQMDILITAQDIRTI